MFVGKSNINYITQFVDKDSILKLVEENYRKTEFDGEKIIESKFATYIIEEDSEFEVLKEEVDYKLEDSYRIITEVKLKKGIIKQVITEQYYDKQFDKYYLRTSIFEYKIVDLPDLI